MTQHFTKATVEAPFYCKKCGKTTQHRISDGRKSYCIPCFEKLDADHKAREAAAKPPAPEQRGLF